MAALAERITLTGLAQLAEALEADGAFRREAAAFTGRIGLGIDAERGWLAIHGGAVPAVGTDQETATIDIVGDAAAWEDVLRPVPGGLHRAWRHRLLQFRGDDAVLLRHYKMIWQLGAVLSPLWRSA